MSLPLLLFSQSTLIEGNVTDKNGNPLIFTNVYIKGGMEGSTTNAEGYFSFSTKKSGTVSLICSYIGYESYQKELDLKKGQSIWVKIVLMEKSIKGERIAVVASAFTSGDGDGVTLTPLEVVQTPGAAADIFWAIKSYPGVQQVDEGAGLFVRGGDVSETAVILDGAYLNHPYRYESPNGGYFGTITPFLLKGTYFSSGGYGAEYGNALSGALVMESMDIPYSDSYTIGVGLAALSGAMSKIIIPGKFGISLSGNYSDTEPMFNLNNNRLRFSRFPKAYDINMNMMYKYSSSGSFKLFVFREVDEIGIEVKNPQYGGFYEGDSKNNLLNLQWKHLFTKDLFIGGNIAYTKFKNNNRLSVLDLSTDESLYQVRIISDYTAQEKIKIKMGIESFYNLVNLNGSFPEVESDLDPNAPSNSIDLDFHSHRASVFLQTELTAIDKLTITPGIRSELHSKTGQVTYGPRISITYSIANNWNLIMSSGRYHQLPKPFLYDSYVGNPKLSSMQADHYIVGLNYQKEQTIARLEGYYKKYSQLILDDQLKNYSNKGNGFAQGIDLFLKHSFGFISGRISYSYLKARRHWHDTPQSVSPDFDITQNLNTVLQIKLSGHFQTGLAYHFASGKPYTSSASLYNDSRTPDYHKLDLSASYLYRFFDNNLTIFYVGFSNLLGHDNIFDYYYSPDYQDRYAVKSSMLRSVYFGVSSTF